MSVYRLPTALTGRTLVCVRCGEPVRVFEPQGPFLNPQAFVCGECLVVVEEVGHFTKTLADACLEAVPWPEKR